MDQGGFNIQGVSISDMVAQSISVLTKPSVATFEAFEKKGGQREALIYVGVAAAIVAVVSFVFGIFGGIGHAIIALVFGFIGPIVGFFLFALVLFYIARSQGGTGTQEEVFYTVSLYTAPILAVSGIVGAIPFINCILLPVQLVLTVYQAYLAYLAARSSMNLDQTKGIISVVGAIVAMWIGIAIVASISGLLLIGSSYRP